MARLVVAAFLAGLAFLCSGPSAVLAAGRTVLVHVPATGRYIVVGPADAQRLDVTVRGRTRSAGRDVPVADAPMGHAITAVPLPDDVRPDEPVVVRIHPAGAGAPAIIADEPAYDRAIAASRVSGIVLGVFVAILALQLGVFVVTREPSIPWYAVFVTTFGLIELLRDGILRFGLSPAPSLMLLDLVNGIADVGFVVVYLRLWSEARRTFWRVIACCSLPVAVGVGALVVPASMRPGIEAFRSPVLLTGALILSIAAASRARRFPPAKYLVFALGMAFLAVVYRQLRVWGIEGMPFLDRWAFELTTTADAILFAVAVIARLRYAIRERTMLEVRLHEATYDAQHDPLTGVLNRRGLAALGDNELMRGVLFSIDLDGFKTINDRFGHADGDRVLMQVAQVLRTVAGERATIARMGGDEFVVICPDVALIDAGRRAADFAGAIAAIRRPADGGEVEPFGASVGYAPLAGHAFPSALRHADAEAYREKSRKRLRAG